jgi:hypothetical protein
MSFVNRKSELILRICKVKFNLFTKDAERNCTGMFTEIQERHEILNNWHGISNNWHGISNNWHN